MRTRWRAGERDFEVEVEREADGRFRVVVAGRTVEVHATSLGDGRLQLRLPGGERLVVVTAQGERRYVHTSGRDWVVERVEGRTRRTGGAAEAELSAPMPGMVTQVHVAVGDRVEKGAPLITLEAMKMEHVIRAPHAGTVARLSCAAGHMVEPGVPLVELAGE